jgi:hypothetical protein
MKKSGEQDPQEPYVSITLSRADAQALYDHTGTMPHAPGSWSNAVRGELSEALRNH